MKHPNSPSSPPERSFDPQSMEPGDVGERVGTHGSLRDAPLSSGDSAGGVSSGPDTGLESTRREAPGIDPDRAEEGTDIGAPGPRRRRKGKRRDSFLDVSFVILLALFLALLLKTYVAEAYMIRGHSMEPTFHDSQRVMVQKVFYHVDHGDIVIFASKEDPGKDLIKRVVGLPGDQVQVLDGEVFLNGKKLDEDYITHYRYPRGEVYGPEIVPEDTLFVLGDNRPESQDSRAFNFVHMASVKGKVILRWWPADEIRTF